MHMHFRSLALQYRSAREVIEFSSQVTFFHGQLSTGKSSIARLLDFCLGGRLERTPAIQQELVSAQLLAILGRYEVIFERESQGNNVQVSWRSEDGGSGSVLAPLQAGATPVWGEGVYNLSDLIFFLLDIDKPMVRRSKQEEESALVRLSFRDVMWYCYLDQNEMDSSFFELEVPMKKLKSRDVMRYVLGFYTERMNSLEIYLDELQEQRQGKINAAKQIRAFLEEYGLGTTEQITLELEQAKRDLDTANADEGSLRNSYRADVHFADTLREQLRELAAHLNEEEQTMRDLNERIADQEELRAELLSAKFKMARSESASTILAGVSFDFCPACGTSVKGREFPEPAACFLCGQVPVSGSHLSNASSSEAIMRDLTARIYELEESLTRHKGARRKQQRRVEELRNTKINSDHQLNKEMENYDSAFLTQFRHIERHIATLQERVQNLHRIGHLPGAVTTLNEEADRLTAEIERVRRELDEEKGKLGSSEQYIEELEGIYLQTLLETAVPGIHMDDQVNLNRTTWLPYILPHGDSDRAWSFANAGSGGKRTLLKVCYALSLHAVAKRRNLPLPDFIVIDSPMKNISPDVNQDNFVAFYYRLYEMSRRDLNGVQFVIIDNDFPDLDHEGIEVKDRYLSLNDAEHPPLIPYYRGP